MTSCPRCAGYLRDSYGDVSCINCGWQRMEGEPEGRRTYARRNGLMSISETCRLLHMQPRSVMAAIASGEIRASRTEHGWDVDRAQVEAMAILPDGCKRCTTCLSVKPVEDFHFNKGGRFGRAAACRTCLNEARMRRKNDRIRRGEAIA